MFFYPFDWTFLILLRVLLLGQNRLRQVRVQPVQGTLSDHYHPRSRVVGLYFFR